MRETSNMKRNLKKKRGMATSRGSRVLAHAIRYRHHEALASIHGPVFALAGVIPRREGLHKFSANTQARRDKVYEHIYRRGWGKLTIMT